MLKVLHVSAQKPNSTGSGIYLSGLIGGFNENGIKNALVMGLNSDDDIHKIETNLGGVGLYPLVFDREELNFDLPGMSDTMPYRSTRYRDMTEGMINKYISAFKLVIEKAIDEFNPDVIISHHLYLVTALTESIIDKKNKILERQIPVFAICHGTCLRQLESTSLDNPIYNNQWIIENIKKLTKVFALHDKQKMKIVDIFALENARVDLLGSGFDDKFFNTNMEDLNDQDIAELKNNKYKLNMIFAGKLAKAKGLLSLMKALKLVELTDSCVGEKISLKLAGSGNSAKEYDEIVKQADQLSNKPIFLGQLIQADLAKEMKKSDLFILPSFYEGLPVVILEAMACGCDVIATEVPGLKGWLGDNISKSGKIKLIALPKMVNIDQPVETDLEDFEKKLAEEIINSYYKKVSGRDLRLSSNIGQFTWKGLSDKLLAIIFSEVNQ